MTDLKKVAERVGWVLAGHKPADLVYLLPDAPWTPTTSDGGTLTPAGMDDAMVKLNIGVNPNPWPASPDVMAWFCTYDSSHTGPCETDRYDTPREAVLAAAMEVCK